MGVATKRFASLSASSDVLKMEVTTMWYQTQADIGMAVQRWEQNPDVDPTDEMSELLARPYRMRAEFMALQASGLGVSAQDKEYLDAFVEALQESIREAGAICFGWSELLTPETELEIRL